MAGRIPNRISGSSVLRKGSSSFGATIIESGVVLSIQKIRAGSAALLQIYTKKYGKISAVISAPAGCELLDFIEVQLDQARFQKRLLAQHESSLPMLLPILCLDRLAAARDVLSKDVISFESAQQAPWLRSCALAAKVLDRYLLPYVPREEVWSALELLFETPPVFRDPRGCLLLSMGIFFAEEGIDQEAVAQAAGRMQQSVQVEVLEDVKALFSGSLEEVSVHRFSAATEILFADVLGISL